ncbi:MAG TPA: hypothetical protein VFV94_20605 [Polyangiaceae bacterium]|nr:hypothetical protein [Polyangiaceae bacterium]
MAESDAGRSATGTVSTEEAERLSERFRPSWEDDPPTVPREAPPPAAPAPAPAPSPGTTAKLPAAALGGTLPLADPRRPTLLGISPEVMAAAQRPRGATAEDLDWEVPNHPAPGAAVGTITDKLPAVGVSPATPAPAPPATGSATLKLPAVAAAAAATATPPGAAELAPAAPAPASPAEAKAEEPELSIDVEEVPPDSKPSGLGEKYVPKEEGAPPVVLNDDVQAAERRAQAALEAQHRARRAPTIARLKVVEMPEPLVSADPFVAPKKKNGRFTALAIGVVVLVAGTTLVLGGRKSSPGQAEPAASPLATVAPDTAAPPPPPLPSAEAAPAAPNPPPEGPTVTVAPAEPAPPASAEKAPEPAPKHAASSKAPAAAAKPPATPKPVAAAKPAVAAAKPAAKPGGANSKPAGKAVIVRDSPF